MKNENSNLPLEIKGGIFSRIRNFIFKLFGKQKKELVEEYKEKEPSLEKDVHFKENIKFVDKYQEEKSIKAKLDKDEIKIADLSGTQKQKMINFYKKEIKQKEEKLNNIKQRILKLKHA